MAFEVLSTPARNVSLNNVSYWGAAFNPQVFEYQRKDAVITDINGNGSTVTVQTAEPLSDGIEANLIGSYIFASLDDLKVSGLVLNVTPSGSGHVIELAGLIDGNFNGEGFMNFNTLNAGYKFNTAVKIAGQTILARHTPNLNGYCRVDLQVYLRTFVKAEDSTDYSQAIQLDSNAFAPYQVGVSESYNSLTSTVYNIPNVFYIVNSALQFNELGSNMGSFVPFESEQNELKLAKFLTETERPVFNLNYPFDLAFIYSEQFSDIDLLVSYTPLDVNGKPVPGGITPGLLLISPDDLLKTSPVDFFEINNSSPVLQIAENTGVNRLCFVDGFLNEVCFVDVFIYYLSGQSINRVSEIKRVAISHNCESETVYLKWLNRLGGWDYELFDYRVTHQLNILEVQTIERPVLDYGGPGLTEDVLSKKARKTLTVGKSGISSKRSEELNVLLTSPKVYMLTNKNPYSWQTVIVDSKNSDPYNSKDKHADFEIELKLPALNLQSN